MYVSKEHKINKGIRDRKPKWSGACRQLRARWIKNHLGSAQPWHIIPCTIQGKQQIWDKHRARVLLWWQVTVIPNQEGSKYLKFLLSLLPSKIRKILHGLRKSQQRWAPSYSQSHPNSLCSWNPKVTNLPCATEFNPSVSHPQSGRGESWGDLFGAGLGVLLQPKVAREARPGSAAGPLSAVALAGAPAVQGHNSIKPWADVSNKNNSKAVCERAQNPWDSIRALIFHGESYLAGFNITKAWEQLFIK